MTVLVNSINKQTKQANTMHKTWRWPGSLVQLQPAN